MFRNDRNIVIDIKRKEGRGDISCRLSWKSIRRSKMTNREEEILQWIRENPMISQQELAEKAGITRSSVAVHISNLMKKGYISGKGYVLSEPEYAVVVGGLNRDIGGIPFNPLVAQDSNPGKVTVSIGGVGRNIANNMALLGVRVYMLTAIGSDEFTHTIEKSCKEEKIDISRARHIQDQSNATYLFIADEHGDMEIALSDMKIFDYVTPEYLAENIELLNKAKVVVSDTNIPEESLRWLCENCKAPIFVDPVSTIKAAKLENIIGKIHTLKPNRLEAEYLTGIKITDDGSLKEAADKLLESGLKRVFISLGADGVYCADSESSCKIPCPDTKLVNTTGGGDAFMGALVWAYMNGKSLEVSGKIAGGSAAIAVECEHTINHELNIERALKKAGFDEAGINVNL